MTVKVTYEDSSKYREQNEIHKWFGDMSGFSHLKSELLPFLVKDGSSTILVTLLSDDLWPPGEQDATGWMFTFELKGINLATGKDWHYTLRGNSDLKYVRDPVTITNISKF